MAVKISYGLALIHSEKVLLVHPTNSSWEKTFSFPKGARHGGFESPKRAAVRETKEEAGIDIPIEILPDEPFEVLYKKENGHVYKKVYIYIVDISDWEPEKISPEFPKIPKSWLQLEEVDWAGFVDARYVRKKIFRRFEPVIEHIFGEF